MRILNFGSLNIDYVYDVDHFVRAGETLASRALHRYPGGKGLNQSIALARAGVSVTHAGKVGPDGEFLVGLLAENGVDTSLIAISSDERTGNAIIQRDPAGNNCILLYGGTNKTIDDELSENVFSRAVKCDWLLLQNEISNLEHIVALGKQYGMQIALNPSPAGGIQDSLNLDLIDFLILNETEASVFTGLPVNASQKDLAWGLIEKFPKAKTVLTLGEQGSVYLEAGAEPVFQKAYPVDAVDTTAAGDTYTGFLLAGIIGGDGIQTSMRRAAAASAIAVTRPGAAVSIPKKSEVEEFLQFGN
jgi:ribokinase